MFWETLGKDDKLSIVCPIPSTAAKIRVVTPDRWWPRAARGIIDKDVPEIAFDLDIVKKPVTASGLQLTGKLKRTEFGIGGSFKAAKAKPRNLVNASVK